MTNFGSLFLTIHDDVAQGFKCIFYTSQKKEMGFISWTLIYFLCGLSVRKQCYDWLLVDINWTWVLPEYGRHTNCLFLAIKANRIKYSNIVKLRNVNFHMSIVKVASSRLVYYSFLKSLGQRYISIKFPLNKESENAWVCY